MPRIFIDIGDNQSFDMQIEPNDEGTKLFIKIKTNDGVVYSGEIVEREDEFMSPPEGHLKK
jgi:hypothetical protein